MFGTRNEDCKIERKKRLDRQMEVNDVSLRFYLAVESDDDVRHDVKSVRVRRQTTVDDILPTLREKFQLQVLPKDIQIYTVTDLGEIPLPPPARPLDIVLQSDSAPRFVIRTRNGENRRSSNLRRVAEIDRKYGTRYGKADCENGDITNAPTSLGRTGNRGAPVLQNDLASRQDTTTTATPDLVGDCRRRPIIPTADYDPLDIRASPWTTISRTTMLGSDSKLDQLPDAMSDVSFGPNDSTLSDTGFGRKKEKRRKRTKSRDRSADSRDFKSASKRGSSLRSSKSTSSLFHKTFSLRKKDDPLSPKTELSTEETSPGILKIFGDSITPGANYKSVLAVTTSTSRELVKEALERYGISKRKSGHYVLCDVIGHFMNYSSDLDVDDERYSLSPDNSLWTEECIRIIGDNERPLVLQRFWKPAEGYARRFELRKRSDLMVIEDKDTSGVNANVRRLLMSKVKYDSAASSVDSTSELESVHGPPDDDATGKKFSRGHPRPQRRQTAGHRVINDRGVEERTSASGRVNTPTTCPFLVNLHGYNPGQDCVMYPITHRCVKVGSDRKLAARNLYLTAPDILLKHCELRLSMKNEQTSARNDVNKADADVDKKPSLRVQIHIHEGADVRINGVRKTYRMELHNGDVINFGEFYQFVYRDPYATRTSAPEVSRYLPQPEAAARLTDAHAPGDDNIPPPPPPRAASDATERENSALKWRLRSGVDYDNDQTRLKLSYCIEKEDELLQTIINLSVDGPGLFKLTPAYLLSMAVEYSTAKHDQICTRTLLLKLATKIHNNVLRRARTLAEKQASQSSDPCTSAEELLSDLCPITMWMVNALELYHHFREHLTDYLMDPELSLSSRTRASVATAGDEVIGTLEEVVMYTFQQTVYYLTKALYICLPALTEGNPFQDETRTDPTCGRTTMDQLISVFQMTLDHLTDYKLHPEVTSQLFCYLFFFTSTSVFNSLMAKGCAEKHFRWSRGVQLRGNLDCLEAWAVKNGFSHEASTYLKKLVSLANLLSTPKVQLIKSSWMTLRDSFPDLNPTQLNHVLSNYEDGRFSQTWQPTVEDAQLIQNLEITESFNGHPPLRLPTDGFLLDLNSDVGNVDFYKILKEMNAHFGTTDDDVDSGLSLSQNFSAGEMPRVYQTHIDTGIMNPVTSKNQPAPTSPAQYPSVESGTKPDYVVSGMSPGIGKLAPSNGHPVNHQSANRSSPLGERLQCSGVSNTSDRSKSIIHNGQRPSPVENQRFRPIQAPMSDVDNRAENTKQRQAAPCGNHYLDGKLQSTSFTTQPDSEISEKAKGLETDINDVNDVLPKSANYAARSVSFSYSDKSRTYNNNNRIDSVTSSGSRRLTEEPLYANVTPCKRREPTGSLNSSISSQISRDGNEVYHYMKDAMPQLDGQAGSASTELRPPVKQTTPLYRRHTCRDVDSDINRRKSFVSDGSYPGGSSQVLDVVNTDNCHSSSLLATIHSRQSLLAEDQNDVFSIELPRGPMGFGMGLIDGLHTPLRQPGIYVVTLVAGSPAQMDGRLRLGDRILAVNGSSVLGVDYSSAMQAIKDAGEKIRLKVVHSDSRTVMNVTASPC